MSVNIMKFWRNSSTALETALSDEVKEVGNAAKNSLQYMKKNKNVKPNHPVNCQDNFF